MPPKGDLPRPETPAAAAAVTPQDRSDDALQSIVTALYCKILVILGLALPLAEVISVNVPQGYYQLFYVYLFLGSLLFLFGIHVDIFRTRAKDAYREKTLAKKQSGSVGDGSSGGNSEEAPDGVANVRIGGQGSSLLRSRVTYGSFYLRMGAMLFGIGSMIYSGIEVGMFFEQNVGEHSDCDNLFSLLRPVLQMLFVFVQMYFIFLNQKMNIYKSKFVSRFGLMHMIATNLCIWFNVLILETSHEIMESRHAASLNHSALPNSEQLKAVVDYHGEDEVGGGIHDKVEINGDGSHHEHGNAVTEDSHHGPHYFGWNDMGSSEFSLCERQNNPNNIMSRLLTSSGPFLFPCTIEYSLICAAVLFVMWKHIDEEHNYYVEQKRRRKISRAMSMMGGEQNNFVSRSAHHYSVDCARANNGLFTGILVMVFTIILLIVFFVLINNENEALHNAAILVASVTELALYTITTAAVVVGMIQIRGLWYDTSRKLDLDTLLLVVAQTGVFIYAAFCIIGSFFQLQDHLIAFLASLATLVQATLQTLFILDASSRFAYKEEQVRKKPGREVVTFLLVCNLAMWAINTLETNRADSHPIQVKFYGGEWVWPIITHVSMPLAIFYRFHSTVCLCEIWKKSFKYKTLHNAYV